MAQYITVDAASKTVTLEIDAGLTNANGGLNFNGKDHGGATIEVPEGYTVKVNFTNKGMLPHSALVTTPDQLQEATITKLAFDGAETPNPQAGVAPGGNVTFQFDAATAGNYVIVCGVPGHGLAGQWRVNREANGGEERKKGTNDSVGKRRPCTREQHNRHGANSGSVGSTWAGEEHGERTYR